MTMIPMMSPLTRLLHSPAMVSAALQTLWTRTVWPATLLWQMTMIQMMFLLTRCTLIMTALSYSCVSGWWPAARIRLWCAGCVWISCGSGGNISSRWENVIISYATWDCPVCDRTQQDGKHSGIFLLFSIIITWSWSSWQLYFSSWWCVYKWRGSTDFVWYLQPWCYRSYWQWQCYWGYWG